ncbi:hypothetical protein Py17XNL_000202601 [Plasmodium yoelii yoelii]|uniref:Uncharacterized protein n=1 Tax=Plasmodium yoelii yoelii TaxID=73239 RepID=A0AAE9WJM4_PLAYO|nr:hypothetical protein Py17XNL_000202601 [Plasmodium yoelii yoelii]
MQIREVIPDNTNLYIFTYKRIININMKRENKEIFFKNYNGYIYDIHQNRYMHPNIKQIIKMIKNIVKNLHLFLGNYGG